ncbi:TlpA disulfide reductase family protein [Flavobacterium sp.]|uniref:TlpA family protein disulfide reductase n=1 Tax=Flavobacterium sp. TaxID=239 RepID=UPI00260BE85A|nr:TlpA disulfide reductase family protein [Flavobacterium sp.]MDD2986369.1 TlpA disulfide reductase family protein [Flavobacterium sp.]
MKNILFLFSLICVVACQKNEQFTLLSGTIQNADSTKITLEGINFSKEISMKNGIFADTLTLPYEGLYNLILNDENMFFIYLENGFQLNFVTESDDFYQKMNFTGTGSAENNFLVLKRTVEQKTYGLLTSRAEAIKVYSVDENAFLAKGDLYKKEMNQRIKDSKIPNSKFLATETKDIDFYILKMNDNFPRYHAFFTENPDFKPSANFPKLTADFNMDDETLYLNSFSYQTLTSVAFQEYMYDESDDKSLPIEKGFAKLKTLSSKRIQSDLVKMMSYEFNGETPNLEAVYKEMMAYAVDEQFKKKITEKFEILKNITKGSPSPTFDYENVNGGTTSLESLKGKLVYIDVWATWCGPCIGEIPALKEVEKTYHGKNIEFVSISIDDRKDHEKWKKMVADKELKGIQLFADADWKSDFVKKYAIDGIPRFILLDAEGKIVNADAPRPSDPKLIDLLTKNGL